MSPIDILAQANVHEDRAENEKLSDVERISNLENDLLQVRVAIYKLVLQNDRYVEYLDTEIENKKDSANFWKDVRKKIAVSGIWGTIIIIGTAVVYAIKQWILTH